MNIDRTGDSMDVAVLKTRTRQMFRLREKFLVVQPHYEHGLVIIREFDDYADAHSWRMDRISSLNESRILTEREWLRQVAELQRS